MSMLHAILSILVGALGGLSARVIFSFAASVCCPCLYSLQEGKLKFLQYKPLWLCAYWLLLFPCMILQ